LPAVGIQPLKVDRGNRRLSASGRPPVIGLLRQAIAL